MTHSLNVDLEDATTVLHFGGPLNVAFVAEHQERCEEAVRHHAVVVVDLGGVTEIDSGGLGFLVRLRKATGSVGAAFYLRNIPPVVDKLLEVTRLRQAFPVRE